MTDPPSASAAAEPAFATGARRWIVAPLVAIAAFMEILDIAIANVSLRHIAGSLAASPDQATWVLTSYLVTNAIVLPISGWMSTTFGRKRFYLGCIAGFGLSSLLCGLAPNLGSLIFFRAVQGLTGGGLQPGSQAILSDTFPPRQRSMAFAIYGMAVVCAPAIGPTLGGWITDNYSWHWIFLINVPVSIGLFFLIDRLISDPAYQVEERQRRRREGVRFDGIGFLLLALGLGLLQVVLDKGQEEDWFASNAITLGTIVCVASLIGFVVWEWRHRDPIVDLSLFRSRNFAISNLLMFLLGFVLLASTQMLPAFTQSMLGYTALSAGEVLSPGGLVIVLLMPVVGRLATSIDVRWLIGFGLAVCAYGLYRMSHFTLEVDYWTVAVDRIIQAAGLACLFVPITSGAYVGLPREKNNTAAALINLARNLGGSVGIAVMTFRVERLSHEHRALLVEHINPTNEVYRARIEMLQSEVVARGGSAAEALRKAQAIIADEVQRQADLLAFTDSFRALAILFICLIPLLLLLRRPPSHDELPAAH
jgi:drug resistance transporter, EmrB/QacA subfamily